MRTLTFDDFAEVHRAFNEAFSDYVVKMSLTAEQLREMLTRRGWAPHASVAEFHGDRITAFTLNGLDGERAYDSGTGVVPSLRRTGLGKAVMNASFDVLRKLGVKRYVLEVIESNEKAAQLYRNLGFVETRRFQCWTYSSSNSAVPKAGGTPALHEEFDVQPSWQNETASLLRARDKYVVLGDERGFAAVFPSNGDLAQLAVRRNARRQGIGRKLLNDAASVAGKPLRILNIDDRDRGIAAFLEAVGAVKIVRQIEMIYDL